MGFVDKAALITLAKPLAKKAYDQCLALDPLGPDTVAELVLLNGGFIDGSGNGDATAVPNDEKAKTAYVVAYNLVLGAMDIARTKVEEAQATPTKVKFRKEYEYFERMLKRLATQAGIDDSSNGETPSAPSTLGFVPHCP